jgi:hypothetical protein
MRDAWLEDRIGMTKKYGMSAIAGVSFIAIGIVFKENSKLLPLIFIGMLMLIPFLIHETIFPVWHWKRRYRGEHSDLWGALLVIETSGLLKLVYWFRHILPDWHGTGRYSD